MRPNRSLVLVLLGLSTAASARGAGPAEGLLQLVPPDAGATLTIEDLRGHAREFCDSPLAQQLGRLPVVQSWLASDALRKLRQARAEIEKAMDLPLGSIRDQVLGEAVVLAIHLAPDETADRARGLLLLRVRDRVLLDRLVERINSAEMQGGLRVEVSPRSHRQVSYWARKFPPGTKSDEFYTIVGDDAFAWSNSEDLIRGVIDRKAGAPGLAGEPRFRKVRDGLPTRSFASVFVNPRFLERLMAADTRSKEPAEERLWALLTRNLAAVEFAGAALEWRNGFLLHSHESIDPSRLDESLRRWPQRPGGPAPLLGRVPATALALVAGHIDFNAIYDVAMGLVPDADRLRVDNVLTLARGMLMNKDPRTEVLPCLGPGVLIYADSPGAGPGARWPLVVAVSLCEDAASKGVAAALDNALRTMLAVYALDPKQKDASLRIEAQESLGVRLTVLRGTRPFFAYAVDRGLFVFGNSVDAVAGYCAGATKAGAGSRFARFRAEYFPERDTFAFVDLPQLYDVASARREALGRLLAAREGRPEADARHDLDQVLALVHLFEGAFATSAIDPNFTSVHRTLGLIARDPIPQPTSSPTP